MADVTRIAGDARLLLELAKLHRWAPGRTIDACSAVIGLLVRDHADDFAAAFRKVIRNFEDAIVAIAEERKN